MDIRILTLWQPWATLIALGLKQYETRSWGTPYRGKLVIHAAKRPVKREEVLPILYATGGGGVPMDALEKLNTLEEAELPLGEIVAVADLTDCQEMYSNPIVSDDSTEYINTVHQTVLERAVGDWSPGRFAWKLENIRPLAQPIPCQGGQGLRYIKDPTILKALEPYCF